MDTLRLTALVVVCCVGAITGIAAFVPAWRASGLNPLEALRHD
jgi:ABC-type lipoprotein release transport system permease subunit